MDSRKDALASAASGEALDAQAARCGRTEISTKQLDSKELLALRDAEQAEVQNWVRNAVVEAASKRVSARMLIQMRWVLRLLVQGCTDPQLAQLRRESATASRRARSVFFGSAASAHMHVRKGHVTEGDIELERNVLAEPVHELWEALKLPP